MKKALLVCLITIVLGIGAGLFVVTKLEQRYTPLEPKWETSARMLVDPLSLFPDRHVLYILALGTDYNYTDKDIMYTKNTRSDTIILIRLNLDQKTMKFLSIPRDTRIIIPGYGHDRINSAFAVGGPKLSETMVQDLTQTPIDYFIRIKEQGLKSLVDAIGGINVDVEKKMDYDDNWGHLHIHLKKGMQHLDGDHAAEYARFRHDEEGDYGRIRRQQQVIRAIEKRFSDPGVIADLESIIKVARQNVETDLKFPELVALGNLFKGTSLGAVQSYTFPTTPKDYKEGGYWVSYVEVQEDEAKKVLAQFSSDDVVKTQSNGVSVEILNGSGIPGRAQEVAEKLRTSGYLVSRVGNADRFDYVETEVVDHTGKGEANNVVKILQKGTMMSVPQEPRPVDLTVIVGRDI